MTAYPGTDYSAAAYVGCPTALRPDLSAHVLAGRYRLDHRLGPDTSADVYAAWDLALHRRVACKVYPAGMARGVSEVEARLRTACRHPNLMPLLDAAMDAVLDVALLVIPHCSGADLATVLFRQGRLSFCQALHCVDQACSALDFLWLQWHAVHGAIHPSNLWIAGRGAVLLLDFDLHTLFVTVGSGRAGSPGFSAPEARHGQSDPRSDVFSLGCVLYACLTGMPPFADDNAVLAGRFTPLRVQRPDASPELEALVHTALDPDPARRHQTARELQGAIRYGLPAARLLGKKGDF